MFLDCLYLSKMVKSVLVASQFFLYAGRSKCDDADEHNAMSIWEQVWAHPTGDI